MTYAHDVRSQYMRTTDTHDARIVDNARMAQCAYEDASGVNDGPACRWDSETMGSGDHNPATFSGYSFVAYREGCLVKFVYDHAALPTEVVNTFC